MYGKNKKNTSLKQSHPNSSVKQGKKSSGKTWRVPPEFYRYEPPSIDETDVPKVLKKELIKSNYEDRFHALLYLSEMCDKRQALKNLKISDVQLEQCESIQSNDILEIDLTDHFD